MSIVDLIRPELAGMQAYAAAEQLAGTIRLNANESPWTLDGDTCRRPLNRYPEIRPAALRKRLAARFECPAEALLVTRGSSEAIDLLIRAFCRAGKDRITIASPTFSMYAHYAQIQDAGVDTLLLDADEDFSLSASRLLEQCGDATKLVFLCSPNNPTGTSIPAAVIEEILDAASGRFGVVIDEAYIEFSGQRSCTALLARYEHLIVLRTLSKALAFAGARCGAVIADPGVIAVLDAVQAPYAMATPVVECVERALDSDILDEADRRIDETVRQRDWLAEQLSALPIVRRLWPSDANFLLVEFADSDAVMRATRERHILLRRFGGVLARCVRISVGTAKENEALLASLESLAAAA